MCIRDRLWRGTPKRMKKGFPRCGGKPYGGEGGIRDVYKRQCQKGGILNAKESCLCTPVYIYYVIVGSNSTCKIDQWPN